MKLFYLIIYFPLKRKKYAIYFILRFYDLYFAGVIGYIILRSLKI